MADRDRAGIGGWLAALIAVIVIGPALIYGGLIWFALSRQAVLRGFGAEAHPVWSQLEAIWILSLVKLAIAWSIAGAMLRFRAPWVIRVAIAGIWLLLVGMIVPDWLLLGRAMEAPPWRIAINAGIAVLVTLYLLRSMRVRNTYNPRAALAEVEAIFE